MTFAVVAVFAAAAVRASVTDTCCDVPDASMCCPKPSIVDDAANLSLSGDRKLRVVNDPARCCSDDSGTAVGCMAYGVAGCSFCRDVCDEHDESCVPCSVAKSFDASVSQTPTPLSSMPGEEDRGDTFDSSEDTDDFWGIFEEAEDGVSDDQGASFHSTEETDDLWGMFGQADDESEDEITLHQTPGSYDFSDDPGQYDCSACSWDRMSKLEQRLLTQRSRSMVCDSSCLQNSGDANYGVTLCNYFNSGKGCRACCHVSLQHQRSKLHYRQDGSLCVSSLHIIVLMAVTVSLVFPPASSSWPERHGFLQQRGGGTFFLIFI